MRNLYRMLGKSLYKEYLIKKLLKWFPDVFINNAETKNKVVDLLYVSVYHMLQEEEEEARLLRRTKKKIRRANRRSQCDI